MDQSVFEEKPNLDYGSQKNPTECDMWDVFKGETTRLVQRLCSFSSD